MNGKKAAGLGITIVGGILLAVGLLLALIFCGIGGIMKHASDSYNEKLGSFVKEGAIECDATIVARTRLTDGTEETTVEYYVESEEESYRVTFPLWNSEFQEGRSVKVYYNVDDPTECMFPEIYIANYTMFQKIFMIVGGVIGGIMSFIGLPLLIVGIVLMVKKKKQSVMDL